jgi:N-acyl-D-amino-acid deacylase
LVLSTLLLGVLAGPVFAAGDPFAADQTAALAPVTLPTRDELARGVERGLAILQRGAAKYPERRDCFSCHHQTFPLLAMDEARQAGLPCDSDLFAAQLDFVRTGFDAQKEKLSQGRGVPGRAAAVSYALWTFRIARTKREPVTEALASFLLETQREDGSWHPPSIRPPLEESPLTLTVLAADGLAAHVPDARREAAAASVERARRYLDSAACRSQEELNVRWWGRVKLGPPQHSGEQSSGESDAKPESKSESKREAKAKPEPEADVLMRWRDEILAAQRNDGGWSQTTTMTSDAYATGQTLWMLLDGGVPGTDPAVARGLRFLLAAQCEDGSWHVRTRAKPVQVWFDNGDPHGKDQFLSMAATGWATAALARAARPAK